MFDIKGGRARSQTGEGRGNAHADPSPEEDFSDNSSTRYFTHTLPRRPSDTMCVFADDTDPAELPDATDRPSPSVPSERGAPAVPADTTGGVSVRHRVWAEGGAAVLVAVGTGLGAGWGGPVWVSVLLTVVGVLVAGGLVGHLAVRLGRGACRQAGVAERAQAAAERGARDIEALSGLIARTSREADLSDAFRAFLSEIREATAARYAALSIFDEDGQVEKFFTLGMTDAQKERIGRLPQGEGLLGHIHEQQEVLRLDAMSEHDASVGFPEGHPPMQSLLAAPITYRGEALGSLYLSDKDEDIVFDAADERLVRSAAEAAAVLINEKQIAIETDRMRQSLRRETDAIGAVLSRLAEGDLTVEVNRSSHDANLDALWERLAETVHGLRKLLGDVRQATTQLSSTSDQIAATTQQMAAGAEEQSAQTEEVASAMEEMSRTVLDNAKTTERTADLAARTERTAEANAEVVRETVAKMNEIGAVVERSVNTVRELGMSSEEIGEIVATIDEIADQTNLLALNAAIEAARAGEHGAGFAVVADEVRELAERTAQATARIEEMITGIQAETQRAVAAMDDGQQEVEEGIDLADQAGDALETMIGNVQEVTDDIGEIAAATEQQSTTSEQISHSVNSISTVTGQTAQGVTEIATSADVLADLSDQLVGAIDQFKFQDGVDGRDVQAGDGAVASGAPDALVSTPRTR